MENIKHSTRYWQRNLNELCICITLKYERGSCDGTLDILLHAINEKFSVGEFGIDMYCVKRVTDLKGHQ